METFLWILQGFLAFTFLYSGICKSIFPEKKLVQMGQTGVEGFPAAVIKLIGVLEIVGSAGLILPWLLWMAPLLTPIAATCFAFIMLLAAPIHYKRREYKSVFGVNLVMFLLALTVAYFRFRVLYFL